jgi:hypothetical protein
MPEKKSKFKKYSAMPGYTLVGGPEFPYETDDEDMQKQIEGLRAFRAGLIWVDERTDEEAAAAEKALEGISFEKLKKIASTLGYREVGKYSKVELLDILEREGR